MLVGVLTGAFVLGTVILTVYFTTHVDVELFVADPAEKAHLPAYTGLYTYAGAFALLVGGAISLYTAMLLRGRSDAYPGASFFALLGVLLAWLGIDDLFMFHEWAGLAIAEIMGQGDEPGARSRWESVVFVAYGIAWIAWLMRSWRTIRETGFLLLLLALAAFTMSVAIDVGLYLFPDLLPRTAWMPTTIMIAEEMLKLTGIFFAFAYVWETSLGAVRRVMD